MTKKPDKLAVRTTQLVGFGAAAVLFTLRITLGLFGSPVAQDVPWWVITGAFGTGVSGSIEWRRRDDK